MTNSKEETRHLDPLLVREVWSRRGTLFGKMVWLGSGWGSLFGDILRELVGHVGRKGGN